MLKIFVDLNLWFLGLNTFSLIFSHMILVISSPSSSTTGLATLIRLPVPSAKFNVSVRPHRLALHSSYWKHKQMSPSTGNGRVLGTIFFHKLEPCIAGTRIERLKSLLDDVEASENGSLKLYCGKTVGGDGLWTGALNATNMVNGHTTFKPSCRLSYYCF